MVYPICKLGPHSTSGVTNERGTDFIDGWGENFFQHLATSLFQQLHHYRRSNTLFIYNTPKIAKMTTLQPPPAPDAAAAIPAFSTTARLAFDTYLSSNASRFRITRTKRANIVSWLIDDQRAPSSQSEGSQRHHIQHTFRYNADGDVLVTIPTDSHSQG